MSKQHKVVQPSKSNTPTDRSPSLTFKITYYLIVFLVRLILIKVGDIIDNASKTAKYTDTDYYVFSDAATHVYNGRSPYDRHTYRYTPLVAYMCTINNFIHPLASKVLFSICDVIMAMILWALIDTYNQNKNPHKTVYYVSVWTFNPLILICTTRGSNDNIISLLVFIALYFILKRQYLLAGLFYGLSVHFKIYPIIYSIVFYLFIDCNKDLIL